MDDGGGVQLHRPDLARVDLLPADQLDDATGTGGSGPAGRPAEPGRGADGPLVRSDHASRGRVEQAWHPILGEVAGPVVCGGGPVERRPPVVARGAEWKNAGRAPSDVAGRVGVHEVLSRAEEAVGGGV